MKVMILMIMIIAMIEDAREGKQLSLALHIKVSEWLMIIIIERKKRL